MKKLFIGLLFVLPFMSTAGDITEQGDYPIEEVRSITYKVTFHRDEMHDQQAWQKLVTEASNAIKRAALLEQDATAATNEIVDAFVGAIKEIYAQSQPDVTKKIHGIHGRMSIEIADAADEQ